jgi:hypothetical protein
MLFYDTRNHEPPKKPICDYLYSSVRFEIEACLEHSLRIFSFIVTTFIADWWLTSYSHLMTSVIFILSVQDRLVGTVLSHVYCYCNIYLLSCHICWHVSIPWRLQYVYSTTCLCRLAKSLQITACVVTKVWKERTETQIRLIIQKKFPCGERGKEYSHCNPSRS